MPSQTLFVILAQTVLAFFFFVYVDSFYSVDFLSFLPDHVTCKNERMPHFQVIFYVIILFFLSSFFLLFMIISSLRSKKKKIVHIINVWDFLEMFDVSFWIYVQVWQCEMNFRRIFHFISQKMQSAYHTYKFKQFYGIRYIAFAQKFKYEHQQTTAMCVILAKTLGLDGLVSFIIIIITFFPYWIQKNVIIRLNLNWTKCQ